MDYDTRLHAAIAKYKKLISPTAYVWNRKHNLRMIACEFSIKLKDLEDTLNVIDKFKPKKFTSLDEMFKQTYGDKIADLIDDYSIIIDTLKGE